eukprot:m.58501 g.58501  ORF g.58501 m.58501 type:complete len:150 (-) comp11697_c0_seq2:75-524(-)
MSLQSATSTAQWGISLKSTRQVLTMINQQLEEIAQREKWVHDLDYDEQQPIDTLPCMAHQRLKEKYEELEKKYEELLQAQASRPDSRTSIQQQKEVEVEVPEAATDGDMAGTQIKRKVKVKVTRKIPHQADQLEADIEQLMTTIEHEFK